MLPWSCENPAMNGDDFVKSWRDYRHLRPLDDINVLLRRSQDPGWAATRELLRKVGWTNLDRLFVISGDILGAGVVYVLLPDETVASIYSDAGAFETCSVQEFADWDVGYAELLWIAVVWLRYRMRHMRDHTRALRESDEPKWQEIRSVLQDHDVDPATTVIEDVIPDQSEEVWYFVPQDRRHVSFDIPYRDPHPTNWWEHEIDYERYPQGYQKYELACWFLDAEEGKTSDWIFTRPYDWWENIKPGWNPPFGRSTYESAEEAALEMMSKDVVKVTSITPTGENQVDVVLDADDDPSGLFPMTIKCEQLPSGRWRQAPPDE